MEAAELKHLLPVLWALAQELLDEGSDYERLILGALASSCKMDEVMTKSTCEWTLSYSERADFCLACSVLNHSLTQLGLLTHAQRIPLWNYTVKNHVLEHIGLEEFHPRLTWNFGSESVLMHVRTLIQGNKSQQNKYSLQALVLQKWLCGLQISMRPLRLGN